MTKLSWLHLSDWHQKGPDFDRKVVRDALIEDIRQRTKIDPDLDQIDFIIFSGDLTFSGKSEEFDAARKHFLGPVLEATSLKVDQIFCVPGNHDLNRDTVYDVLPPELQKPLDSDALVQKWLTDAKKQARVMEPFEAYQEFISNYTHLPIPDYASIVHLHLEEKHIALLGLNSAWMCARNKDAKGEINDYGYLLVGEPQIHDALAEIKDADLRIAVMHHPFEWLASFDRDHIETRLRKSCNFILRGHEHNSKVEVISGTSGSCVIIPAGASYERRIAENPRYTNAYNFVHLDFDSGQGTVYLRRWSEKQNEWIADTDSHSNGKYFIESFLEKPGDKPPSRFSSPSKPPPQEIPYSENHYDQQAEKHYRDLLLETCDIINLANLPEQDRHIVQKQQELKLRGLYIPLRVWVEASAKAETPEPGEEEKLWEAMEKRRAARKRSETYEESKQIERKRTSVGERLASAKRLVILGDPGAGKTTLTRWIATAYLLRFKQDTYWKDIPDVKTLPDADWLPVIVRCRELDKTPGCLSGSLDDILKHTLRKSELSEVEVTQLCMLLKTYLEQGKALLMLDGLDEITDPVGRASFCQQLERIVVAYPNAPIIATSRIVGYREMGYKLGRGFEHLTLADLMPEEKDDFVHRWSMLTETSERRETAIRELIHDIHSADRIERLTGNPMLLTTMALVKRKVGKLPNRRADLYGEAVQVLLNWRSDVEKSLDTREAIPQLEYLAYAMCDRGVQQLRRGEVVDLFMRMREEYPNIHATHNRVPEEFLKHLEARTGILVEAGHVRDLGMLTPVYEFRHLTFQEYLAACALVDGRFPGRVSTQSLAEQVAPLAGRTTEMTFTENGPQEVAVVESWSEALRLCISICKDDEVDKLLQAILTPLEGEQPPIGRARAILAALCLADEPNASLQSAEQVLQVFASQVNQGDGNGLVRTGIDIATMELTETRWKGILHTALMDEYITRSPAMRYVPGGLLGMVGTAKAIQDETSLVKWLAEQTQRLSSENEKEAIDAALGIMEVAYKDKAQLVPNMVEALLDRLSGTAPMGLAAAWALMWLKKQNIWKPNSAQVDMLIAFISKANSEPYAVLFLASIFGDEWMKRLVEPQIEFWLASPDAEIRRIAAVALGNIGSESAVSSLIARLDDSDPSVRRTAVGALGNIGSESAVSSLTVRLDDSDPSVRSSAAEALGNIGSESAVSALIAHLDDSDPEVRSTAAEALGNIGSECAVSALIARLDDSDPSVRSSAAEALGNIGSESAVSALIAHLDDSDPEVRSSAAEALVNIGSETAVSALIARLDDSDPDVRSSAAIALGKIGSEAAVSSLIARLDDSDPDVRRTAADALGNIGSEAAVSSLIARLDDSDPSVRSTAAEALGNIGSECAVSALIARLDDSDPSVRSSAAEALGNIGSESAVSSLIARLDDSDPPVRRTAVGALGNIGSETAVSALITRLDDSAPDVRRTAVGALGIIGSETAISALIARLDDSDPDVRSTAADALGKIGSETAVSSLIARLDDSDPDVRSTAAEALGNIGSECAVSALIARLDDSDPSVRSSAAEALGNIGSETAISALIARLDDSAPDVRRTAVGALGIIGSETAISALIARLDDSDPDVRSTAAGALVNIGSETALSPLITRLDDSNPSVRRTMIKSLAHRLEEVDRKLLSRDLDGISPFVDPHSPIREVVVRRAAKGLKLPVDEVRARYEVLAEKFHLNLAWDKSPAKK